jgi:pimeloyl-ACP methyl ester carboxylesterase
VELAGLDAYRAGAGDPLVLLHGIGHTWRGWKPMLPLLEERFDVLAVDMPGFGHSPPLPEGVTPSPEGLADAVERALDEAGFDAPLLAGNSLGGWVALELARRGRARGVVALSPAGMTLPRESDWGTRMLRTLRWLAQHAPAEEAVLRTGVGRTLFAGPTFGRPWRADPADVVEQSRLLADAPGFERTLDTMDRHPYGLDAIRCPVLLLWGTRDVLLLPRQGRRFERVIPNAELRYLKGLGHVPMSDDPELLAGEIARFASALPRPEAAQA